ncbi:MAG: App1 family protein [Cyclobacteriaceae bacterium]
MGWLEHPVIQPYTGYGNAQSLHITGRILEKYALSKPIDRYNKWDNFKAMYFRYSSDFVPGVRLRATFQKQVKEGYTDDEGYFYFHFEPTEPLPEKIDWFDVHFKLLDKVVRKQKPVEATGKVMVSELNSQFGIISDVDDTILVSRATTLIRKLRLLLLKNAHTRLPFEGVAAFYHALRKGSNDTSFNPIFYVSSSSWKLYDLLVDFAAKRGIPPGPFLLRASRIDHYRFISDIHSNHKLQKIEHIMATYNNIKFILIGDSGQKDPEIYDQVVKDYPGRVEAIYIRDVSKEGRDIEVRKMSDRLYEQGIEMVFVQNTEEAARHALEKGYISEAGLQEIIGEKALDEEYSDDPEVLEEEQEQNR